MGSISKSNGIFKVVILTYRIKIFIIHVTGTIILLAQLEVLNVRNNCPNEN